MSFLDKFFNRDHGDVVVAEPLVPKDKKNKGEIPEGKELTRQIDEFTSEMERKPIKRPPVFYVLKSGKRIPHHEFDEHRKKIYKKNAIDLRNVRARIEAEKSDDQREAGVIKAINIEDELAEKIKKIREHPAAAPAGNDSVEPLVERNEETVVESDIQPAEAAVAEISDVSPVNEQPADSEPVAEVINQASDQPPAEEPIPEFIVRDPDNPNNFSREELQKMRHLDPAEVPHAPKGVKQEDITPEDPAKEFLERVEREEAAAQRAITEKYQTKFGVSAEDLKKIEGWEGLSGGQKLFILENLSQFALSQVKAEAKREYAAGFKSLADKDQTFLQKAGVLLSNMRRSLNESYHEAELEKMRAKEVAHGGLERYGLVLQQLTDGMQGGPEIRERNGHLEMQFLKTENDSETSSFEAKRFNDAANEFMRLPKEWSYENAKPGQKRIYEATKARYEAARAEALEEMKEPLGEVGACVKMNNAEAKIYLNQFLNQNEDAENEIIRLSNQNVNWQSLLNFGKGKRLSFLVGGAIRCATVSVIGAVAAPIAGGIIGGVLAQKRAKESLAKKDESTREKGWNKSAGEKSASGRMIMDKSAEAKNFVAAEDLENKLDLLALELDKKGLDPEGNPLFAKDFESLQARVAYTQRKIDDGLVVFGRDEEALTRQYRLLQKLFQARARLEVAAGDVEEEEMTTAKRLHEFLDFKKENISAERTKFIIKKAALGAAVCAGFASAGWAFRHLAGGTFHWKLVSDSVKNVFGRVEAAPVPSAQVLGANEINNIMHDGQEDVRVMPLRAESAMPPLKEAAAIVPPKITSTLPSMSGPHEEFEAPVIKAIAVEKEIPQADFQGGHSVWQEAEKQLKTRLGERFSGLDAKAQAANVARLTNTITEHKESFGLEKNLDFQKMSDADLRNINWNEAVNNTFGDREGLTEHVRDINKILTEPDAKLVHFNGSHEQIPMGDLEHATRLLEDKKMEHQLADWSAQARIFYDPHTSSSVKDRIFSELERARGIIKDATGGTMAFELNGDIKLTMPDAEPINIFNSHENSVVDLGIGAAKNAAAAEDHLAAGKAARPATFHRPSLGYRNIPVGEDITQGAGVALKMPAAGAVAHEDILAAGHEDITGSLDDESDYDDRLKEAAATAESIDLDARDIKGSFTDVNLARQLTADPGYVDLRNVTSISKEALLAMQGKPHGAINLFGLKAENINRENCALLFKLKAKVGIYLNDAAMHKLKSLETPDMFIRPT